MAGISPVDGGYQYYARDVQDIEDEKNEEVTRARKRYEERLAELETAQEKRLVENERKQEKTIENVRDAATRTIAQERELARAETDQIKRDTYNRRGVLEGRNTEKAQHDAKEMEKVARSQHEQDQRALKNQEERSADRMNEVYRENERKFESALNDQREATKRELEQLRKGDGSAADYREQLTDRYRQQMDEVSKERSLEQRRLQKSYNDMDQAFDKQMAFAEAETDRKVRNHMEVYDKKEEEKARAQAESREAETSELRKQIGDILEAKSLYSKGAAEGRQEMIKDIRTQYDSEMKNASHAHELEKGHLAHLNRMQQMSLQEKQHRTLREHEEDISQKIHEREVENHERRSELKRDFEDYQAETEEARRQDRERASRALESQAERLAEARQKALEGQADAFRHSSGDMRKQMEAEITELERQIKTQRTTTDPNDVSPAAAEAFHRAYARDNQKALDEEVQRNETRFNSLNDRFRTERETMAQEAEFDRTMDHLRFNSEIHRSRNELQQGITDLEMMTTDKLQSQESEHRRSSEMADRVHGKLLSKQEQQHSEQIEQQRMDSEARLDGVRTELNQRLRLAMREANLRHNDMVRKYEKMLVDQKEDYEDQLSVTKSEAEKQIRVAEHANQRQLEEQKRDYEFRIAQLDVQQKERERKVASDYQEQIDAINRAHERLLRQRNSSPS